MDSGTRSNELDAERYWRRRAVALAGILTAVGLLAWACGAGGGHGGVAGSPASPPPGPPIPAAAPTVTVTATPSRPRGSGSASARRGWGGGCDPEAVTVTMTTVSASYGAGRKPRFRVIAVSTGARPCRFDVGPGGLEIRVTSGRDKVWSSAACARGSGSRVRTLRKGVPYVTVVTWDRRRAAEGCEGPRPAARPGTYVATIDAANVKSPAQVFLLRA
ncbi:hypothetical protein [Spirillospora sp. NPDC029432]|uniref:hypothetical protein n=1 Tax=Spirillospora sp. NPDC029432 TaxID=3154599 RepID=UPI00345162D4